MSPEWKDKVGAATSVAWPAGAGAKGNDGVAATVHNTRGGLGYVENAYATQNHLVTTQLKNKAGNFIAPSMESFAAAASAGDWTPRAELRGEPDRPAGRAGLADRVADLHRAAEEPEGPARSANVIKFFDWAYKNGARDRRAARIHPAARAVQNAVRASWRSEVKGPDGKAIY